MIARRLADKLPVDPKHLEYAPVTLTAEGEFVKEIFESIRFGCLDTGWVPLKITWSDLAAWQQVTGIVLNDWVRRLVFTLNTVAVTEEMKRMKDQQNKK